MDNEGLTEHLNSVLGFLTNKGIELLSDLNDIKILE